MRHPLSFRRQSGSKPHPSWAFTVLAPVLTRLVLVASSLATSSKETTLPAWRSKLLERLPSSFPGLL
ncbi:hypothetical protein OKW41_000187 [Paraburkholderia sp. UCT70]|uniref:hypothetical protein n=1 Tax=Paraburkholderia sp. UCT70 TaxID=2991068 RepID=UPI003D21CC76